MTNDSVHLILTRNVVCGPNEEQERVYRARHPDEYLPVILR
jgi:hypothetical protein